jgi:D-glycero-alpha-D-manno-heptose-7-phosphate kinase
VLRSLTARAPARVDFGGGWTDVPPYCDERGGVVCNLAIARYARVRLVARGERESDGEERAPELALARAALARGAVGDVAMTIASEFPVGAGLGGSSAAGVAAVGATAAWRGEQPDRTWLAQESRRLEVDDLGVAGGWQDHYAAAFGGALGLRFDGGTGIRVERVALAPETVRELERRCTVIYTGRSRISGETITAVLDAYRARRPATLEALDAMKTLATQMIDALRAGSLDDLARLVNEHWERQRSLHPAITTPLIEEIVRAGRAAGALGAKALGASGGGCVLVVAPADRAVEVRGAVAALGELVPFAVDEGGFAVEEATG